MAINGIAPPSAAMFSLVGRTNAPDQTATTATTTTGANGTPATTTAASTTDVAGTVGALSPSVLAALVGQDVKLLGSLAGA